MFTEDWQDTQAARAFLILSHFAGVAVMAQLILATLSMIKATLRVAIHSVTCVIQGNKNENLFHCNNCKDKP